MQTEADILLNNAQVHETRVSDLRTKIRCYVCGGYGPSSDQANLKSTTFFARQMTCHRYLHRYHDGQHSPADFTECIITQLGYPTRG